MSTNYSEIGIGDNITDPKNISLNEFGHSNFFDKNTSETIYLLAGTLLTIFGVLGIIGNFLSILVIQVQKRIHASLSVLLIGLSVSDLLVCALLIVVKGLPTTLKLFDTGESYQELICVPKKYIFPVLQSVLLASAYFTVAITLERFIAVSRPLQAKSLCTPGRARQVSLIIVIFSFLSNFLSFYHYALRQEVWDDETQTCKSKNPAEIPEYIQYIRLAIYAVVHYLVPLVIVILGNAVIITKIHKTNSRRASLTQNQLQDINLTSMLIVVVAVYVTCNIFRVINELIGRIGHIYYVEFVDFTNLLVMVNSASNCLIYCAYGKGFRDGFVKMFCKCECSQAPPPPSLDLPDSSDSMTMQSTIVRSIRRLSEGVAGAFGKSQKRSCSAPSSKSVRGGQMTLKPPTEENIHYENSRIV